MWRWRGSCVASCVCVWGWVVCVDKWSVVCVGRRVCIPGCMRAEQTAPNGTLGQATPHTPSIELAECAAQIDQSKGRNRLIAPCACAWSYLLCVDGVAAMQIGQWIERGDRNPLQRNSAPFFEQPSQGHWTTPAQQQQKGKQQCIKCINCPPNQLFICRQRPPAHVLHTKSAPPRTLPVPPSYARGPIADRPCVKRLRPAT